MVFCIATDDVSADLKNYYFTIVDALENEEDVKVEQEVLDGHELVVMELAERLGRLVVVPLKTKQATKSELLRKRIDVLKNSFRLMKGQLDVHVIDMDIYTLQGQQ